MFKLILLLLGFGFVVYQINRWLDRVIGFFRIFEGNKSKKVKVHRQGNMEIRYETSGRKKSNNSSNADSDGDYVDFEEVK